jgi:hypothetical protein
VRLFATFPATQHPFGKLFVEIETASAEAARLLMIDTFGNRWSILYSQSEWDSLAAKWYHRGSRLAFISIGDNGRATTIIGDQDACK